MSGHCEKHDLANGPDGRCALCHRDLMAGQAALVRKNDRLPRTLAKIAIGVAAGLATFVLLLVLLDTSDEPSEGGSARDASASAS